MSLRSAKKKIKEQKQTKLNLNKNTAHKQKKDSKPRALETRIQEQKSVTVVRSIPARGHCSHLLLSYASLLARRFERWNEWSRGSLHENSGTGRWLDTDLLWPHPECPWGRSLGERFWEKGEEKTWGGEEGRRRGEEKRRRGGEEEGRGDEEKRWWGE